MKATILTAVMSLSSLSAMAQLTVGGYGEAVMTRNFYSQSFNRYKNLSSILMTRATDASTCPTW